MPGASQVPGTLLSMPLSPPPRWFGFCFSFLIDYVVSGVIIIIIILRLKVLQYPVGGMGIYVYVTNKWKYDKGSFKKYLEVTQVLRW